jgi:hypothetical protein
MLDIIASMAAPLVRETLFAFAVRAAAVVAASDFTLICYSLFMRREKTSPPATVGNCFN